MGWAVSVFDIAFAFVIGAEGSKLSLDPRDPGNWTPASWSGGRVLKGSKYGISAYSFPDEDIPNMTAARAATLAKPRYWDPLHGDQLPPRVALIVLDAAYNQGQGDAARFLQRALDVKDDGVIGPTTLKAIDGVDAKKLARRITVQRIMDYSDASAWNVYRKGWVTRAVDCLVEALSW